MLERKKGRAGFTLVELAIALAVMSLVMAGVWSVVNTVWNNYKVHKMQQQVLTVVQNVRDYFMNKGVVTVVGGNACSSNADITGALDHDSRRLIPIEMRRTPSTSGNAINHALAKLGSGSDSGSFRVECLNNGSGFRIRLLGLRQDQCMRLLLEFPVMTPEIGVNQIWSSGGGYQTVDPTNLITANTLFPINGPTAVSWCSQAGVNNEVRFDFKLRN